MNEYIIKIQNIINKFKLDLYWYNSIETSSFIKFNFITNSMIHDILKYESEFKSMINNIWLESKNGFISLCIPKNNNDVFSINEILKSDFYNNYDSPLKVAIGETVNGDMVIGDIIKWVNVLIAGIPDSGKSNFLNVIVNSLILSDHNIVKLMLFDFKKVELTKYRNIPHLIKPIITDVKNALNGLNFLLEEIKIRYEILDKANVRNIKTYNKEIGLMSYIVVIIDELSSLMIDSNNKVENSLIKIASLGRACGIHLIIATQKPSSKIITTDIKSNIDTRISFKVTNHYDSMVILDSVGAENLRMGGDMLLLDRDGLIRLQSCFISDDEIKNNLSRFNNVNNEDIEVLQLDHEEIEKDEVIEVIESEFDKLYKKSLEYVIKNKEVNQWKLRNLLNKGTVFCDNIIEKLINDNIIECVKTGKVYKIKEN